MVQVIFFIKKTANNTVTQSAVFRIRFEISTSYKFLKDFDYFKNKKIKMCF